MGVWGIVWGMGRCGEDRECIVLLWGQFAPDCMGFIGV